MNKHQTEGGGGAEGRETEPRGSEGGEARGPARGLRTPLPRPQETPGETPGKARHAGVGVRQIFTGASHVNVQSPFLAS